MKLLATLLLLVSLHANAYEITSPRVIDGDTFESNIKPFPALAPIKIRLLGIDTPELRGKCEKEKQKAKDAKTFVARLVKDKPVQFDVVSYDKYGGRVNGNAFVEGKSIATLLIDNELAAPYSGSGPKRDWCK